MFEQVYEWPRLIGRHREAPLRSEREQYLRHLLKQGYPHSAIRSAASYMLHLIRILELNELRVVDEEEIKRGADCWTEYRGPFRDARHCDDAAPRPFIKFARAWLRFHGKLALPPGSPFREHVEMFSNNLQFSQGLAAATIRDYSNRTQAFLNWLAARGGELQSVCLADIDQYLAAKSAEGWQPRSIVSQCKVLRSFFRFAEKQAWCVADLSLAIRSPRISTSESRPKGPTWVQVRQLLTLAEGNSPEHLRARALLLLFAIYGLRCSEVINLRLEDFDWHNELFTVRRAKRGGIQQYPIQYEVGEAILNYLQHGRPHVACRHVFLGERRPWGPLQHSTVWRTTSRRMRKLRIELDHLGPHALRHTCATRLLQKGSSLQEIADFLGHHDTKSVGIYAKYDIGGLRTVAAFGLMGLL